MDSIPKAVKDLIESEAVSEAVKTLEDNKDSNNLFLRDVIQMLRSEIKAKNWIIGALLGINLFMFAGFMLYVSSLDDIIWEIEWQQEAIGAQQVGNDNSRIYINALPDDEE